MKLVHGPTDSTTNLQSTMAVFKQFLKDHPSEFLVLRIKSEDYKKTNDMRYVQEYRENFERTLRFNEDVLYRNYQDLGQAPRQRWPSVGELRGKMIILNNLDDQITTSTKHGPLYDRNTAGYTYWVQDAFKAGGDEKLEKIKSNLSYSSTSSSSNDLRDGIMYINFISHTAGSTIWNGASDMNNRVLKLLNSNYIDGKWIDPGIMVMDYPGDGLVQAIIDRNSVKVNRNR